MTDETIVAVFDTVAHAQAAVADLKTAGVPDDAVRMHANTDSVSTTTGAAAPVREEGFWASLFGGSPDHDTAVYDRSLASGSTMVSVRTPESHVSRVLEILESHQPIDIDEHTAAGGVSQSTMTTARPVAAATPVAARAPGSAEEVGTLQLAEETLAVGKRVVNRGGTRIRRFVVETPVEESVTLHSEKVVLERHPVTDGRPATDSFSEKTIEATEMAEEAVVSKTARVVEEIGLHKEVSDRVETVRDTVRKEEAEVVETVTSGQGTVATPAPGTTNPKLSPEI